MSTASTRDEIYVRTDHQCLFAYVRGEIFRVKRDPLLHQTYMAIHLNKKLIYFYDFVAKRLIVEEPIGMAIYNTHVERIESEEKEKAFNQRCQVDVNYLFLLADRKDLIDKDYSNETVYIKGQDMINIVEKTEGYADLHGNISLEELIGMKIDRERLYEIPWIENDSVDLSPDIGGVPHIIEYNFSIKCEINVDYLYSLLGHAKSINTGYKEQPLYIKGQHFFDIVDRAGYEEVWGTDPVDELVCVKIDRNKYYYVPPHLIDNTIVDLCPSRIQILVEYNDEIANFHPESLHITGENLTIAVCSFGQNAPELDVDIDKKYYIPSDLKSEGKLKPLTIDDITHLINCNNLL
jgi:hypothetical protein